MYVDLSDSYKGKETPTKTVLVSGLIQDSSDSTIHEFFSKFGKVYGIVRSKEEDGKFTRYAFVHFDDESSVDKVLAKRQKIGGFTVDCRRVYGFNPEQKKVKVEPETQQSVKSHAVSSKDVALVLKLMIQNLKLTTTRKMLINYFEKHGTVLGKF